MSAPAPAEVIASVGGRLAGFLSQVDEQGRLADPALAASLLAEFARRLPPSAAPGLVEALFAYMQLCRREAREDRKLKWLDTQALRVLVEQLGPGTSGAAPDQGTNPHVRAVAEWFLATYTAPPEWLSDPENFEWFLLWLRWLLGLLGQFQDLLTVGEGDLLWKLVQWLAELPDKLVPQPQELLAAVDKLVDALREPEQLWRDAWRLAIPLPAGPTSPKEFSAVSLGKPGTRSTSFAPLKTPPGSPLGGGSKVPGSGLAACVPQPKPLPPVAWFQRLISKTPIARWQERVREATDELFRCIQTHSGEVSDHVSWGETVAQGELARVSKKGSEAARQHQEKALKTLRCMLAAYAKFLDGARELEAFLWRAPGELTGAQPWVALLTASHVEAAPLQVGTPSAEGAPEWALELLDGATGNANDWLNALNNGHEIIALHTKRGQEGVLKVPRPSDMITKLWPVPEGVPEDVSYLALPTFSIPDVAQQGPRTAEGLAIDTLTDGLRGLLDGFDVSIGVAHEPELYVMDMRFHMPYGTTSLYKRADFDGDGQVTQKDVDAVRDHIGTDQLKFDLDGDGEVTANDLTLAEGQKDLLVNGIMYRKVSAKDVPLGFWIEGAENAEGIKGWVFTTTTPLHHDNESVAGKVERRGVLTVVCGQVDIPLGDYALPEAHPLNHKGEGEGPLTHYPVRYQLEQRHFLDSFPRLDPTHFVAHGAEKVAGMNVPDFSDLGLGPTVPSQTTHLIVRGGPTGQDWQAYTASYPFNPMLRTWVLRGTLYWKPMLSYNPAMEKYGAAAPGVLGRADVRLSATYETSAPLVEVAEAWRERFEELSETVAETDLTEVDFTPPVPFQLFKDIFEYTDAPRLARALISIVGPVLDLAFDWTDERHHLRAVAGYVREEFLSRWKPAPTWLQLQRRLEQDELLREALTASSRTIKAFVTGARAAVAAKLETAVQDDDTVYTPALIADWARAEVLPGLSPEHGKALEDAINGFFDAEPRLEQQKIGRGAFATSLDQLCSLSVNRTPGALPGLPGLEQSTRSGPPRLTIPGLGEYEVQKPYVIANPIQYFDEEAERGQFKDSLLSVRGNPLYKPIYHSTLILSAEARLHCVPSADDDHRFVTVGSGTKALVQGSRVLVELKTSRRWLWIRTEKHVHGWLPIEPGVWHGLFHPESQLLDEADGIELDLIDPLLTFASELKANALRGFGELLVPLQHFEPSPLDTIDDSYYSGIAREAMARREVGLGTAEDEELFNLYWIFLTELSIRIVGLPEAEEEVEGADTDEQWRQKLERMGQLFTGLSHTKQAKLWSGCTAWIKCAHYLHAMWLELLERLGGEAGLLAKLQDRDFEALWTCLCDVFNKMNDNTWEERLLAAQLVAPGLLEVVMTVIDMIDKTQNLIVKGMDLKSGKLKINASQTDPAKYLGIIDPNNPTWQQAGIMLLRLLIDDGEAPGRTARQRRPGLIPDWIFPTRVGVNLDVQNLDDLKDLFPNRPAQGELIKQDGTQVATADAQDPSAQDDPANVQSLYLARPFVSRVKWTVEKGEACKDATAVEAGDTVKASVVEWGAVVYSGEDKVCLRGTESARMTDAVRKRVVWRVRLGEGPGSLELDPKEPAQEDRRGGPPTEQVAVADDPLKVTYVVPPDVAKGTTMMLRAYVRDDEGGSELESELGCPTENITILERPETLYLFAWEPVKIPYFLPKELVPKASAAESKKDGETESAAAALEAIVTTRGDVELTRVPLLGKVEGMHYLEFPLENVGVVVDGEAATSPIRVTFPEGVKIAQGWQLKKQEPAASVKAEATIDWNFGKDRFGIKLSTEPGAGGGQAADTGSDAGAGSGLSGNLKIFAVTPMFGRMLLYGVSVDSSGDVTHQTEIDDKVKELIPENVTQGDIERATGITKFKDAVKSAEQAGGTAVEIGRSATDPRYMTDATVEAQLGRAGDLKKQATAAKDAAQGAAETAVNTASQTLATIQKSARAAGMFLRFVLSYFYYATDAARLAAELQGDAKRRSEPRSAAETVLWVHVLGLTSALDALLFLFRDDPEYVGNALDLIELELQVEACGSFIAKYDVNIDVNETVSGRCKFTLAALMRPFIEVLLQKPVAEQVSDKEIADRIIPLITGTLEERFCAKVGISIGQVEVESKGPLGELSLFIPPDSPLKKTLIEYAGKIREIIQTKYQKGKEEQFRQGQPKWQKTAQKLLRQLDVQVKAWLVEQTSEAIWQATLSPAAKEVMDKIRESERPTDGSGDGGGSGRGGAGARGDPPAGAAEVAPRAERAPMPGDFVRRDLAALSQAARDVLDLIERTGLRGTGVAQGAPTLEVETGTRGRVLSVRISDAEKAAVEAAGFTPPRPLERTRETVTLVVALPVAPRSVGWNAWTDPHGHGAMGIAAAFASDAEARLLAQSPVQTPPPPPVVWDRPDGLHYAWVETRLLAALERAKLAPPRLTLQGSSLELTFDAIRVDRLDVSSITAALRADAPPIETTWRLVLLEGATAAEESAIRARLGANRPKTRSPLAEAQRARGGVAPARDWKPAARAAGPGAASLRVGRAPAEAPKKGPKVDAKEPPPKRDPGAGGPQRKK